MANVKMNRLELGTRVEEDIRNKMAYRVYQGACADVPYGTDRYSEGIRRLCAADSDFALLTSDLTKRFYAGDYGDGYDRDETPVPGHECAWYETDWGPVQIQRDLYYTTIFMAYER